MSTVLNSGKKRKYLVRCLHCGTDFTYLRSDTKKREYTSALSSLIGKPPMMYFVSCPECSEEVQVYFQNPIKED